MDILISRLVFVKYHSLKVLEYLFVDLHLKVTKKIVEESQFLPETLRRK